MDNPYMKLVRMYQAREVLEAAESQPGKYLKFITEMKRRTGLSHVEVLRRIKKLAHPNG